VGFAHPVSHGTSNGVNFFLVHTTVKVKLDRLALMPHAACDHSTVKVKLARRALMQHAGLVALHNIMLSALFLPRM
jgi:hypothetical protein